MRYRTRKFVRRNKVAVFVAGFLALTLSVFAFLGLYQWRWGIKSTAMGYAFARFTESNMSEAGRRLGQDAKFRDVLDLARRIFERFHNPNSEAASVHYTLHLVYLRAFNDSDEAENQIRQALDSINSDMTNPDDLLIRATYRLALADFLLNKNELDESYELYEETVAEYKKMGWAYRWFYPGDNWFVSSLSSTGQKLKQRGFPASRVASPPR